MTTSRQYQTMQHIKSGLQQCITPIVAATAALFATGNTGFWIAAIPFAAVFLLGRAASEISYRTSICVVQEYSHDRAK